jgi:hypothetical protein
MTIEVPPESRSFEAVIGRNPIRHRRKIPQIAQQESRLQCLDIALSDGACQYAPTGDPPDVSVEDRNLGPPKLADLARIPHGRHDLLERCHGRAIKFRPRLRGKHSHPENRSSGSIKGPAGSM